MASDVITKPAAPMKKAKVTRPPGTMGLVDGGRHVPEYRSDHAIAAGKIPNRTSTAPKETKIHIRQHLNINSPRMWFEDFEKSATIDLLLYLVSEKLSNCYQHRIVTYSMTCLERGDQI